MHPSLSCYRFFKIFYGSRCTGSTTSAGAPDTFPLKMSLDSCDKYMVGVYDLEGDKFVPDNVMDDRRL